MTRFPRPSKAKRRAREGTRQVMIVLMMAAALAAGLLAINEYLTAGQRIAVAAAQGDDEIYTGSILYVPDEGRICHQVLFDNQSGSFTDNGNVDCERAAYHSTVGAAKQWSAARVRVISSGFRQR